MSGRGDSPASVNSSRRERQANGTSTDGSSHASSLMPEAAASAAVAAAGASFLQRSKKKDHTGNGGAASGSNGVWKNGSGRSRKTTPLEIQRERLGSSGGGVGGGMGGGKGERIQSLRPEYYRREFASVRRPSERVTLNLSGTLFMTTRDTLARNPDTYFAAMLRMQPANTVEGEWDGGSSSPASGVGGPGGDDDASAGSSSSSNGVEFFIDRDPTHFRFILNYLRDSYIGLDSFGEADLHFLEELSHEAQFFNISGLCADISRRMTEIARKQREGPSGDKDFRLVQCNIGQIQDLFHEWVIEKNYEFECMQIVGETAYIVLGRRVSRGELALVERLMKT
ncbi:unnamed protein product [Ascophyllum nodosum]